MTSVSTFRNPEEKNIAIISSVMDEIIRFFRIIAYIFAGYVLILSFGFKTISSIECMDWISTFVLVIVISISTFGQYFIGISHSIFLQADQKTYVTNVISIAATVLNTLSIVVLVWLNCNLIIVKLVSSLIFFMRPVVLSLYVRRNYQIRSVSSNDKKTYLTQKWTGLGQHIAYFLHSNTDIAILTIFADLRSVAVYSVYNMIISHMQSLTISFSSGMEAVFGDMLARNEEKKLHDAFRTYETILSVVSIIFFSVATALIVPFIRIYTSGITDADYVQPLFAVLMVLTALSYCLRLPYHSMIIAAGHFKQTSFAAYGEALINIVLSIILVSKYGLIGVSFATLIATWFRFVYYVVYLSNNIFNRKISLFLKRLMINAITFLLSSMLGIIVVSHFSIENYIIWVVFGFALVGIVGAITLGINYLLFKKDCMILIKKIIK